MKLTIFLILMFGMSFICTGSAFGQNRKVHIDAKLPTVFIEFVRFEEPNSKAKLVWLRLKNNSKWRIKLDASGGSTNDSVALYYETLDSEGGVKESRLCHVCSTIDLGPAKHLLFSVPFDEITSADSLRVRFEYEWEDRVIVAPKREPEHYVVFHGDEIGPS